jgi:hypothetical protein
MIQAVRASPKAARRRQQIGAEGRGRRRFAPSEPALSGAPMASGAGDKGGTLLSLAISGMINLVATLIRRGIEHAR